MKQTQFAFNDDETLLTELRKINRWQKSGLYSSVLIHLLTRSYDENSIKRMLQTIKRVLPDAVVMGCSTNGNIVPGEDAEHLLPKLSCAEQYAYGVQAGDILLRIHEASEASAQNWYDRYFTVMAPRLEAFRREMALYDGSESVLRYLKENCELLKARPLCHLHEDYHIGNLILNSGKLWVIDWHTVDFDDLGDPWYEFHCLNTEYPAFASGQIDGYFRNDVPEEFWRLFAFYLSVGTISSILWLKQYAPGELNRMKGLHHRVLQMFNGMQDPHPTWYCTRPY